MYRSCWHPTPTSSARSAASSRWGAGATFGSRATRELRLRLGPCPARESTPSATARGRRSRPLRYPPPRGARGRGARTHVLTGRYARGDRTPPPTRLGGPERVRERGAGRRAALLQRRRRGDRARVRRNRRPVGVAPRMRRQVLQRHAGRWRRRREPPRPLVAHGWRRVHSGSGRGGRRAALRSRRPDGCSPGATASR